MQKGIRGGKHIRIPKNSTPENQLKTALQRGISNKGEKKKKICSMN